MNNRLRELDFIRGVAMILVLGRHQYYSDYTLNMGWIGVDIFFVLSGFLVSGLLFKEYIKFGTIKPVRFLIRRGFKVYPIYYLFYTVYIYRVIYHGKFDWAGFLSDMTFTQNYVWGWGFAIPPSWSLAVEEHFYFGLAFLLWLSFKKNWFEFKVDHNAKRLGRFEKAVLLIMLFTLVFRFCYNLTVPEDNTRSFTMTHMRMDSIFAGVLLSYLYYFKFEYLNSFFQKYKYILLVVSILCLSWTPFVYIRFSFWGRTIGFTMVYFAFFSLMTAFLLANNVNRRLNRIFSKPVVNLVSKIGIASYPIYIIHAFVNSVVQNIRVNHDLPNIPIVNFTITSILSITAGMLITRYLESYILKLRDKYYPSRAAPIVSQ